MKPWLRKNKETKSGLEFRVEGLGFRVSGLGFRASTEATLISARVHSKGPASEALCLIQSEQVPSAGFSVLRLMTRWEVDEARFKSSRYLTIDVCNKAGI